MVTSLLLRMQGYNAKDRKGALFDDWDLPESGAAEHSEVVFSFFLLPINP